MTKSAWSAALSSLLTFAATASFAQGTGLTLSGIDHPEAGYGAQDEVWAISVPAVFEHETGPVTLRVSVPYMSTRGAGGQPGSVPVNERQARLGEATVSGFYSFLRESGAGVGLDLGLRTRFAAPDRDTDPMRSGNDDYSLPDLSLQADLYKRFGPVSAFGTFGYAWKGDIRLRDGRQFFNDGFLRPARDAFVEVEPRSPWYVSVGGSYTLTRETSLGLAYDWRRKLSDSGDVSEATLFMTHRLTPRWRLQGYGLVGFSDASPGWGLGATVGYGF